jgi:hypothetical protein
MATFVVCSRCGNVQETAVLDQLPEGWRRSLADLFCPHCGDTGVREADAASDVLEEEVVYPAGSAPEDTLDEGFCEVCAGPCQGH